MQQQQDVEMFILYKAAVNRAALYAGGEIVQGGIMGVPKEQIMSELNGRVVAYIAKLEARIEALELKNAQAN